MKAYFRSGGALIEADTGQVDAPMLHALWVASVKHGVHVQLPLKQGDKVLYMNVRCLDGEATFDGLLLPRITLPPPPDGTSNVPPASG